jgi:hypothetical protein
MKLRHIGQLFFGIATFIPGVYNLRAKKNGSGGSYSARYCYSVYLRHMVMAYQKGLTIYPRVVAELGPGDSLGVGLMALLLGSEKYYALDVVEFSNSIKNIEVLDELILLLKSQEDIPDDIEFPRVIPKLSSYKFPKEIFSEEYLCKCLTPSRISKIKKSITRSKGMVEYKAPWFDNSVISKNSVDMIISQAVLEHVDDLALAYKSMYKWLVSGGYMTHCIDFKSHGKSSYWDGHWKMPNWYWFLLRGDRPYLLNRSPFYVHQEIIEKNKFKILFVKRIVSQPSFPRRKLNLEFQKMPEDDRETSSVFIQIKK